MIKRIEQELVCPILFYHYMLLIGTGSYEEYHNTPQEHYAYTVYFVAYWPTQESDNWNKGLKKKLDKNK